MLPGVFLMLESLGVAFQSLALTGVFGPSSLHGTPASNHIRCDCLSERDREKAT